MSERSERTRSGRDREPASRRTQPEFRNVYGVNELDVIGDAVLKGGGPDPTSQASALSRADSVARARAVSRLQQTHGNAYVQRIVAATNSTSWGNDDLAQRIEAAAEGGSRLDDGVRRRLEGSVAVDLSEARVHTDGEADHLSRAVQAIAFTSGRDIFFRAGAYNPHSADGLALLAHEVVHIMQQGAGPVAGTPAPGGVSISDPTDSFERAAEKASARILAGSSVAEVSANPGAQSPGAIGGSKDKAIQRNGSFWDWTQGPYGWYKSWWGASGEPTPLSPEGYEGQPRPYPVAQPEPVTPRLPPPGEPIPASELPTPRLPQPGGPIPEAAPTPRVPYAPPGVPTPNVPTPNVPIVEPGAPPPSVEPPTVPRPLVPPGEVPPTLRSPGVQPPPSGPPPVEPVPPTLRSPGAPGPAPSGLASAGRGLGTLAMGGLGTILGGLQLYHGIQGAMEAKSVTDTILPGLNIGAGGALTLGGIGTLTGSASLASLGPAGAVLGSGLAGFSLGRALDEGVGWGMGKIMGEGKGDYSISGMIGKGLWKADETIAGLISGNDDKDTPTYKKTLGWKLAQWLD